MGTLIRLSEKEGRIPFVWIHPPGGGVNCYLGIARSIRLTTSYGIQAQGIEDGLAPLHNIELMADAYAAIVAEAFPSHSVAFGSWSLGALIALELAGKLRRSRCDVGPLFLLEPTSPYLREDLNYSKHRSNTFRFRELVSVLKSDLKGSDSLFARNLVEAEIRKLLPSFGVPEELLDLGIEEVDRLSAFEEASVVALDSYEFRSYEGLNSMLFIGQGTDEEYVAEWRRLLGEQTRIEQVPGSHVDLAFDKSSVNLIARSISKEIVNFLHTRK